MGKQRPGLIDDVLGRVRGVKPGFKTWFDRLPEAAREELNAAKAAFNPAMHQKRAFAQAVMEAARERGWETAGINAVIAWLNKKT